MKGDAPKAGKASEEVIQIAPQNPVGYYQQAGALLAQKKEKEALIQLEKALSLQPNYLEALDLLVGLYLNQKDPKKAIQRVETQIQRNPKNPYFYQMLGKAAGNQ